MPERPARPTPARLMRDALGLADIVTATMANIAPAMSFYFGFGLIAVAAGVASPLTVISAAAAIALLGNTLSQFSRVVPSTGSFITYIGLAFGPASAVATALVVVTGYIVAMGSVITATGAFTAIIVHKTTGVTVPWQMLSAVLVLFAGWLMMRGIQLSTRWAGYFFAIEILVMIVVSLTVLVEHRDALSWDPLRFSALQNGVRGLGLGFPLAAYMFIGWENSAALAEETTEPRRNVPRAVYLSIAAMAASYLLFAYVTVVAFDYDMTALGSAELPFVAVADRVLGHGAFLAYLGGMTSTLASLIAGTNSQARLLFSAGREGLLPAWVGEVHPTRRTPVNALAVFIGLTIVLVVAWTELGDLTPVETFSQLSSFGALLVLIVYLVANLSLPVFFRRHLPEQFRVGRHLVVPLIGVVAIWVPVLQLVRNGQPAPYNAFPWAGAVILVCAAAFAMILTRRRPTTGDRLGSVVADE